MYSESPNNIDKLVNVLMSKPRGDKIDKILAFIKEVDRLNGVIIDPKSTEKKSVRNFISHRERIDIFFAITLDQNTGKYSTSYGALLNMRHPEVANFPNYRVVDIAGKIWFLLMGIIENCFQVLFNDPPSRGRG